MISDCLVWSPGRCLRGYEECPVVGIGDIACVKAYVESIFIGRHDPEGLE